MIIRRSGNLQPPSIIGRSSARENAVLVTLPPWQMFALGPNAAPNHSTRRGAPLRRARELEPHLPVSAILHNEALRRRAKELGHRCLTVGEKTT